MSSEIQGNTHFRDRLSCGELGIPDSTVLNAAVGAGAAILASKLQHQHVIRYSQIETADTVTAGIYVVHICKGAGNLDSVEVTSSVAPTADTDFFTVDIQKARAGVAASVLTGIITYNNTNALAGDGGDVNGNYGIITGTIDGAEDALVDNDTLEVVITVTDNGGTNASGLCVIIKITEVA